MNPDRIRFSTCMIVCVYCTAVADTHAAWSDVFRLFTGESSQSTSSALTNSEMINGLKEALSNGTQSAINNLGRTDGFFKNPKVRIPMPESLEKVEKALRKLKQDKTADELETYKDKEATGILTQRNVKALVAMLNGTVQ